MAGLFTEFTIRDGYVFYDRLKGGEGHWQNLYLRRLHEINSIDDLTKREWSTIGTYLYNLGMAERAKEMALLEKYLPDANLPPIEEISFKTLVEEINRLLLGKQQFEDMLRVINGAINHQKTQSGSYSKERSPMIASYFMSYFKSALPTYINRFQKYVKENCITANSTQWEQQFQKMLEDTIEDTVKRMSNAKEKYAEKDKVWQRLIEFYNSSPFFKYDLQYTIFSQVDFSQLKNLAIEQAQNTKNGYGFLTKEQITPTITISEKAERTLGGLVHENVANAMAGAHLTVDLGLGSVAVKNMSSNMLRTDSVILFGGSGAINSQSILASMDSELLGATSLEDSRNRLQNFYNRNLSNLTDSFMVFVSTKSYAMTDTFSRYGFSDGSPAPISHIPRFLENVDISYDKADLFIKKMYSTIPGALLSGRQSDYIESLRQTMVEAMAFLLFDDWKQIGEQNSGNSIHLFNLDGIYIPLSGLLLAMGKAAEQPDGIFRVSFNKPKKILYPTAIPAKTVPELDPYWETQKEEMKDFQFAVHFLTNFKTLVTNEFNGMG